MQPSLRSGVLATARCAVVAAAALLWPCVALAAARTAPSPGKIILAPGQLGSGYQLQQRPDGSGVDGTVTLDMCGYRFSSEALRTARLQVNYLSKGNAVAYSNEIVAYGDGGAQVAMRQVASAIASCPTGPVRSSFPGRPELRYRIERLQGARGLLPGSIAFVIRITGSVAGKRVDEVDAVVYQRQGNVLSGVYAYGGTRAARTQGVLRAAKQSAKNLEEFGVPGATAA